jgi:hypothetical protein
MLPDRSKRYAGVDGDIPRLVLAANWQLTLIALLVLALLAVIFPRKALVEKLYKQETLDELTLSYIQNLYRADTKNADVALLLARSQQDVMDVDTLESILLNLATEGDTRQRIEARTMLLEAYNRALERSPKNVKLSAHLIDLMQKAQQDELPEHLAREFASRAFELNLPQLGLVFFKKVNAGQPAVVLEKYGSLALGEGHHAVAASYFLLARDSVTSLDESRRLFEMGINTYMSASLFQQAMLAARQYLGNLADDPPTLRLLSHAALAAGDTAQAADYARKLVFRSDSSRP